jgi:hypothetical protein
VSQTRQLILSIALFALLCGLVRSGHRHVEAWAPREVATESIRFLPSGKALGIVSLGYEELLADLLWVRATMLFGERFGEDGDQSWYSWLYHMMDLATDLDPQFRGAYKYGGIMLRVDGAFIEQSTMVFAKGMHAMPSEWYFPFGIAMNYYLYKDDGALAAPYMRRAAQSGGGPFYLANLAVSLTDEDQSIETSLLFLEEERKNVPDPRAQNAIDVKLFELKYQMAERNAQRVVDEYRSRSGQLPSEPELVSEIGLELPPDPLGGRWQWNRGLDAELGSVLSSRYYQRFLELSRETGLGALGIDFGDGSGAEVGVHEASESP